ncbi:MAG TPA: transcription-repair coupling factor [Sandaracinaceae bacterium LLY-WYZ-13_1]|nr:transcription-repair coupling factor [Sandaracinaceae bacterium LLY-WYZ-13_1]
MTDARAAGAVEGALERATARLDDAIRALSTERRVDLSGLPPSAAALLLARLVNASDRRVLLLTPDTDAARRAVTDLELFAGLADSDGESAGGVLCYPGHETSPFVDVAPDRRAAMDRLSALFHLAQDLPWRLLAAPLSALPRRVPPREAILKRSMVVQAEEELDREALIDVLVEGGYMRVPVVEDPGTFAVRGALIDIYPPHEAQPARIELDDWLVLSIKRFDPDDQRTLDAVGTLRVHPVRDALYGSDEIALARMRVRELCDAIDLPTRQTKQLLDDLESGRLYLGLEGFLPAFYPSLDTLFDYLPEDVLTVVLDPTDAVRRATDALDGARRDLDARRAQREPAFDFDAHYLDEPDVAARLTAGPLAAVHRLAVAGRVEDEGALAVLETAEPESVLRLAAEDQAPLVAELKARRASRGKDDALAPLAAKTRRWLEHGMRVVFTARTPTQAERLASLLKNDDVPIAGEVEPFAPAALEGRPPGGAQVTVGNLSAGFVLGTEALVVVTEEEVFGTRAHRKRRRKRRRGPGATQGRAFLEDLRQLQPGDYVVHSDHGVGKYLGIERKPLGLSRDEELRGVRAAFVEVLVVEYRKGDKLFLPVTRLHQLQKYSGGEGHKPKIDRLGGQTFERTKAKVQKKVKQMAEELLRLYAERLAHQRDPLAAADRLYAEFEATFPFEETPDQARAIEEVLGDLEEPQPMDRIVCGDVGFGKTEVAMRAAFRVASAGRQVAVLCPTTVLAQQHYNTFADRFRDYPLRVEVLSRFVDRAQQSEVLTAVREGKVDVLVGTHRLLSKDVHFENLGLLVVDEEQRFGVAHKERIKKLRSEVDVLTLSATPIPRTLQLAVGGLRDLSLITTAPVDRRAVRTLVTRWDDHLIREAIQRELSRGGQVFFVYNRIEGLYERAQILSDLVPRARLAVAHGQLAEGTLERTMTDFVDGAYDVLCSTAIIESGLDIPRANTILIDRADNFGLAQLYQLRGRVGRSKERAYCYLITPPPQQMTDEARSRIEALERFSQLGSGFQVASLDMELRGAGDVLGAEQSGTVAAVGFDLFLQMLQEAVAELRGEPIVHDVDTELTLDIEHYLPDDYIEDVGLRLSFYKRFASAEDEQEVVDLASEMEDRFGPAPKPARQLVRAMRVRPALRALRVLGCEASPSRVTLHLREDTPLDPAKVMQKVARRGSGWRLSPDMKLSRRFDPEERGDSLDRIETMIGDLQELRRDDA